MSDPESKLLGVYRRLPFFIWLLLAIFVVRSFIYASFTIPWQGPDEPLHYDYIHYLQTDKRLPVLGKTILCDKTKLSLDSFYFSDYVRNKSPYHKSKKLNTKEKTAGKINHSSGKGGQNQIAQHPPLYYLLMAILTWPIKNASLLLNIWVLRMFSALLGLGVVLFTYLTFSTVYKKSPYPAYAATAFVALNPMFTHVMTLVNNDSLTNFLFAFFLFLTVKSVKEGLNTRRAVVIGITVGLGLLTKFFFFISLPLLALALVLFRKKMLVSPKAAAFGFGLPILISGFYYLRNFSLYGTVQPVYRFYMLDNAAFQNMSFFKFVMGGTSFRRKFFYSFWSNFGWTAPRFSDEFYIYIKLFALFVLVGLIIAFVSLALKKERFKLKMLAFLSAAPVMLLLPLAYNSYKSAKVTGVVEGVQGRYAFILIGAIGLLIYLGIKEHIPYKNGYFAFISLVLLMVLLDFLAIFYLILPYFYF